MLIEQAFALAGYFIVRAIGPDGTITRTAEFFNLILNAGLDYLGQGTGGDALAYCHVGTGNTAPIVTDTALAAKVATSSTLNATVNGSQTSTAPYYTYKRNTYRFTAPGVDRILNELGVGWSSTALFCRALTKDSGGSPASFTWLSDETLDVSYELRLYPSTTDVVATLNDSTTDHTVTVRPANMAYGTVAYNLGKQFNFDEYSNAYITGIKAYNGALGAVTGVPAGTATSTGSGAPTLSTYTNGSYTRTIRAYFDLSTANLAGGITAVLYATTFGFWQIGFSPAIAKTSSFRFWCDLQVTWGRYAP